MERTVVRAEFGRELRRIEREGVERLVSYQVNGDEIVLVTELLPEPRTEIR